MMVGVEGGGAKDKKSGIETLEHLRLLSNYMRSVWKICKFLEFDRSVCGDSSNMQARPSHGNGKALSQLRKLMCLIWPQISGHSKGSHMNLK